MIGIEELGTAPPAKEQPKERHVQIRASLMAEQWCTAGTKNELAAHILLHLADTLGEYMFRYTPEDIEHRLSDPVQCEEFSDRKHYVFDASSLSYLP